MKPHTAQGTCVSLAKLCSLLLAAAMLLWPGAVRADEFVNCPVEGDDFSAIQNAIALAGGGRIVFITGTCTADPDSEGNPSTLFIQGAVDATLEGPAILQHSAVDCDAGFVPHVVQIVDSGNVTFRNLTITGGVGLRMDDSSVRFDGGMTIENSRASGVFVGGPGGSILRVSDEVGTNRIRNNCQRAVFVASGSQGDIGGNTTITGNRAGVVVQTDGRLNVIAGGGADGNPLTVTIENNLVSGAFANVSSRLFIGGQTIIRNNGSVPLGDPGFPNRSGVNASFGATVALFGGGNPPATPTIKNNTGPGIRIDVNSNLFLRNTVITGNSEQGVLLLHQSVAQSDGDNLISSNVISDFECDKTSTAFGDFGAVVINCGALEMEEKLRGPKK